MWNCFACACVYPGMRHDRDRTLDDPISLGRPIVVGAVAGLIACYGFVFVNGADFRPGNIWTGGEPQGAPVRQSSANPPSYQIERRVPNAREPLDANESQSPPMMESGSEIDKANDAREEPER